MATMQPNGLLSQDDDKKKTQKDIQRENKREFKESQSAKTLLSPRENVEYKQQRQFFKREKLREKLKQGREEYKYARKQKHFNRTNTGNISKGTTKFFQSASQRKPVTSFLYKRNKPASVQRQIQQRINKGDYYKIRQMQMQRYAQQQRTPSQDYYDSVFSNFANPKNNIAGDVERQISGRGSNEMNFGDRTALFDMQTDINASAWVLDGSFRNPVVDVHKAVKHHSKNIHIDPMSRLNKEVSAYSNLVF